MDVDSAEITAISLCSGYEGIGLGLRRVLPGLRIITYSEIKAKVIAAGTILDAKNVTPPEK